MRVVRRERKEGNAFNAAWALHAPWAHPLWSDYALLLMDLTTPMHGPEVVLYLKGATHEMHLWAVDPRYGMPDTWPQEPLRPPRRLEPMNYGVQFIAADDDTAFNRINEIALSIDAKHLSPDTDARSVWDELFKDGAAMYPRNRI